jgi:hypothetical protein
MDVQVVVDWILWNLLQFLLMPFWIGDGVLIPLAGRVDEVALFVVNYLSYLRPLHDGIVEH